VKKLFTTAVLVASLCFGTATQANDVFLANADGSTTLDISGGITSGTIGVYIADTYSIDTGAFMNAFGGDGISITGATVFNPDILVGGAADVDDRWQSTGGGDVVGDNVLNFNGFAVTEGTGVLPNQTTGNVFEDQGHIPGIGFLFAELTWELTGSLGADNTAEVTLGVGDGLIVNAGTELSPDFGSYTITSAAIPEPTTAGLLALGLVGLVSRRRR
ncbi:MAG: PEP-CTERM sorting domain-containing protein, partial [Planctomycetota bacterium]